MRRRTAKIFIYVVYALTLVFAILCIQRGVSMCGNHFTMENFGYLLAGVFGFVLSWLVLPFVHELGHLVFAKSNDFVVLDFSFLWFHFLKQGKKTVFRFGKKMEVLGENKIIPTRKGKMKKRYYGATLGGIFFTGLFFLATFALFVGSFFAQGVYSVYFFFLMFLPASFYYTFFNAIPFENEFGKSDGGVLLGLKRGDSSELTALNILRIQSELYRGVRFREIEEKFFTSAPAIMETDPNFIALTQLRYYYYLDLGAKEKVEETLARMKSLYDELPTVFRMDYAVDLLYESTLKKEEGEVKKYYRDAKILQESKTYEGYKVSACRYLFKGKTEEADEILRSAVKALNQDVFKGRIPFERDRLKELEVFE